MPNHRFQLGSGKAVFIGFALAGTFACASCEATTQLDPSASELAIGTWGGDDAGLIITGTEAHVHLGCTYGDFPAHVALDADRRFSVPGEYVPNAYPVAVGPPMPAQLAGVLRGDLLTLTVAVQDTIEGRLVVFGPTKVEYGREPQMGPCPICRITVEP
jgi:hypothetical protein